MAITRQEGHTSVTNTKRATALILAIAIFGDATTVFAQAPVAQPPAASPVAAALAPATVTDANTVRILVGRSAIVDVGTPIARVSLTSNDIADAMVTTPSQLLVNGKVPGTISMFVWDHGGTLRRYEVSVGRDLSQLNARCTTAIPDRTDRGPEQRQERRARRHRLQQRDRRDKAVNVAAGYVEKKDDVVNLLQVSPAQGNQVLLRVRFAEVSRTALTELGLSLAANGYKDGRWYGRSTTQQFAALDSGDDGRQVRLQRLPEPVPLRHEEPAWRRAQGAAERAVSSRASPSPTWWPKAARKPASLPAARFPCRLRRDRAPTSASASSSRSSASA